MSGPRLQRGPWADIPYSNVFQSSGWNRQEKLGLKQKVDISTLHKPRHKLYRSYRR